ncbi:MAG: ABC transporter ATP-binding protein [Oscillospiraceae bacterium]|jgi:peptide/nickel transport system ATP-binding protein
MSLLEINNLSIHYHTDNAVIRAVNDVSLSIGKGETLGLVGETGAGKTTTALGIMRLIPQPPGKIVNGEVYFKEDDLLKKRDHEMRKIRGNEIAMIFQDPMTALNPVLRVGDQIAEVIALHENCSRALAVKKSLEMLEMVGISAERSADYPHQFSGGMKQRVIIAIALACSPALLIADEPTTALDVTIQAQILKMINELKKKLGTSVLLITHDLGIVAETCSKVAIMYAGEIVEYGSIAQIFKNTSHPYTRGLFGSLPSLDKEVRRLSPIAGLMPDPANLPNGCKFHPRCKETTEKCRVCTPKAIEIEPGHLVKCLLYAGEGAG